MIIFQTLKLDNASSVHNYIDILGWLHDLRRHSLHRLLHILLEEPSVAIKILPITLICNSAFCLGALLQY